MSNDFDMKIVENGAFSVTDKGEVPQNDSGEYEKQKQSGNLLRATTLGKKLAEDFIANCHSEELMVSEADSEQLKTQKILLLSFTVIAGLEQFCPNATVANTARTVFFEELKRIDSDLSQKSSDNGAFSFYFLSFRRGNDIERRIGQTFAMLCLHDGDPIYQELGEAIYCWFFSNVEKQVKNAEFVEA